MPYSSSDNQHPEVFFDSSCKPQLRGPRFVIQKSQDAYPVAFLRLSNPPETLYVVGSPDALQEGLAIVGARKATPYGISCARRFGRTAARNGVVVISGEDREAFRAAFQDFFNLADVPRRLLDTGDIGDVPRKGEGGFGLDV